MATGSFRELDALLQVQCGAPGQVLAPLTCLLDTGFNGFLLLNEASAPDFGLVDLVPGAIEYANSTSAARSYGLGVLEVDGIQRQGLVVLEPRARLPLLGMMFLKAFGFRLTVDPPCGLVEVAPTTPRPRRPISRRQAE